MEMERQKAIKELLPLGLHKELLDKLSNAHLFRLHDLIGWASPVYDDNKKKKGIVNDR
jgi:hypothetical protein